MKSIISKFTHIEVSPYEKGEEPHLEKSLEVFDWISHKVKLSCYDVKNNVLYVPRSTSIIMLESMFHTNNLKDDSMYEIGKVNFQLKTKPRDEKQFKAIRFLCGVREFRSISYSSRLNLELDTGVGKTYCTIAALWHFKQKSAIIIHLNRLVKQWKDKILEYTDISEKEIYVITGRDSINKLKKKKDSLKQYKIFLVSHRTLSSYVEKEGVDKLQELFEFLQIGIKVYDEAHLEFKNIMKIDLHTNVRKTFYLTATAGRSDKAENILYKRVLGSAPTLSIKIPQEERLTVALILKINTLPSKIMEASLTTMRGLNSIKYLRYLFSEKSRKELFRALTISLNTVENIEGQFTILVGLKENTSIIKEFIEENFEKYKNDIGIVDSDIKPEDQENEIEKKIIITTYRSFGTGLDLSKLMVIIMIEPYSSEIVARQLIGRLRNKKGSIFIEILDQGIEKRLKQSESVRDVISECNKKVIVRELKNETYDE